SCGDSAPGTPGAVSPHAAATSGATTPTTTATAPAAKPKRGQVLAVKGPGAPSRAKHAQIGADPQESESFPAPARAGHAAAATPGEPAVAAGAPSDAEVRKELEQMQALERSAKRARTQALTPVAGGRSIGGSGALAIPANVPEVIQKVVAGANE